MLCSLLGLRRVGIEQLNSSILIQNEMESVMKHRKMVPCQNVRDAMRVHSYRSIENASCFHGDSTHKNTHTRTT